MTKQLVVIGTAVMTTLLAVVLLWQFRIVVIYVLISLALAATIRPIARSEPGRKFVTRLVLIVLYVVSLGIFFLKSINLRQPVKSSYYLWIVRRKVVLLELEHIVQLRAREPDRDVLPVADVAEVLEVADAGLVEHDPANG